METIEFDPRGEHPVCISFMSPVDNRTAPALVAAACQMISQGNDAIHLFMSSPGGSVADGIAAYNTLSALGVPITTYNTGTVDSIANVIFQVGSKRIAFPTSRFMFHGVGFDVQNARMEMKDLKERIGGIENDQKMIGDILVRHTNLSSDDVERLFLQAAFVSSTEAIERGIVDQVAHVNLPKGLPIAQLVFQG